MKNISPESDLKEILLSVASPGRYVGGEYRSTVDPSGNSLRFCVSFPDLYEIGMSNNAVKILYNALNDTEGVVCDRVFAPAPDFESLLRARGIPLYGLDTGLPLGGFDVLGFSIGYELSITNVLNILELSGIPFDAESRGHGDPIVIAGGPAVSNPVPFGRFFEGIFIGEADRDLPDIALSMAGVKARGGGRDDYLSVLRNHPAVWYPGRIGKTARSFWHGFSETPGRVPFPVANLKPVHDHGSVEIMRGCPNGCRFCHAGIFYRPFREKDIPVIVGEVDNLVFGCGYREVSLSSLSTGDYGRIFDLMEILNHRYSDLGVSFSLPSMRVTGFTLPLLAEISKVRKSGLTFAVETPVAEWQRGINKEVPIDRTVEIMVKAREAGWKVAKFYFMFGLPVSGEVDEAEEIACFLREVQERSGMGINVNVGAFIPKPHTPFQWARQIGEEEALSKIFALKGALKGRRIEVRYNSPFSSYLEGIVSRGDERVGDLILRAYRSGCRLDAWEEFLDRDAWRRVIGESPWDVESETLRAREVTEALPWDAIDLGVGKGFLEKEYRKALSGEMTGACSSHCGHNCGICRDGVEVRSHEDGPVHVPPLAYPTPDPGAPPIAYLFAYEKAGKAVYLSHLNVMTVFERAFLRAGLFVGYTEGFNPKPRLEFAHPLTLGISSEDEIARVILRQDVDIDVFVESMNRSLPSGFSVRRTAKTAVNTERRMKSLMAAYWGSSYRIVPRECCALSAEDIAARIREHARDAGIEDHVEAGSDSAGVQVRIRQAGKKTNMLAVLKAVFAEDVPLVYVDALRTKTYGLDETGGPIDYFECAFIR